MAAGDALSISGISKSFGPVQALNEVSFVVPRGCVYGLLGPNGAGKSTLLRIVLGLVRPNAGHILIDGQDAPARLPRVGALIETPSVYPFLTGIEMLEALAMTAGFSEPGRAAALLARVGLADAGSRLARSYSLGMKQKLGVACALMTRPDLVILDEPSNGLDPAGIHDMRALLRSLVTDEGMTVLVSSHLLDEVQRVCDRVAILNRGVVVAEGAVSALLGTARLYIEAAPIAQALAVLGDAARDEGKGVSVAADRAAAPALLRALIAAGVDIFEARWTVPNLEEVFFDRTGEGP